MGKGRHIAPWPTKTGASADAPVERRFAGAPPMRFSERENMKRGEVYMADLDPVIGSEQGGVRPVLIIQNDLGNQHGTTVIVAALSARQKKPGLPTHVPVARGQGGLWRDSMVLAEQLRTLERSRLERRLGEVSPETMRRVNRALLISLDAAPPERRNA